MGGSGREQVTQLLNEVCRGKQLAVDQLLEAVYGELRALAGHYLNNERPDHTLQATALVHEAYLRLVNQRAANWQNRAHFFGIAAQAIRRVLIDHARGAKRLKRGGNYPKVLLSEITPAARQPDLDLLTLDEAMEKLAQDAPLDARIVEMRFFAGLTINEIAEALGVHESTVRRHWDYAKAWLYREVTKGDTHLESASLNE